VERTLRLVLEDVRNWMCTKIFVGQRKHVTKNKIIRMIFNEYQLPRVPYCTNTLVPYCRAASVLCMRKLKTDV
jgi:uncharacterized protein YchJ